jgi:hypothetical protein
MIGTHFPGGRLSADVEDIKSQVVISASIILLMRLEYGDIR